MTIAAEYLEAKVLTASPHRLHLLVVDAALLHTRRGLDALIARQWEELDRDMARARNCVSELIGGLRPDVAPELAGGVKELLLFVFRNLVEGEIERDPQRLRDALRILLSHRETWVALGEKLAQNGAVDESPDKTPAPSSAVPAPLGRSWVT